MSLLSSLVNHQTVLTSSPEKALRNTCSPLSALLLPQSGPPSPLLPQHYLILQLNIDVIALSLRKVMADHIWFAHIVSSVWLPFPHQSPRFTGAHCSYPELSIRWASHESPTIISSFCWL